MRTILLSLVLSFALAACTAGPRSQLPTYQTGSQVSSTAAAPPVPKRRLTVGQAEAEVRAVVARLYPAILAPEICRSLTCPRAPYAIEMVDKDVVNAQTDGKTVYVARGLVEFVANEGELAAVLSHEIAHALMNHSASKQQSAMIGAMLGAAASAAAGIDLTGVGANIGALSYSKEYEREADYVGLYLMARAGFYLKHAYDMWSRMASLSQSTGSFLDTHPAFSERLALLKATNDEIAYKISTNQPLVPALR